MAISFLDRSISLPSAQISQRHRLLEGKLRLHRIIEHQLPQKGLAQGVKWHPRNTVCTNILVFNICYLELKIRLISCSINIHVD